MSAPPVGTWLVIGAGVAVAASVIGAIVAIGSPAHQRDLRLDEQRERDIRQLARAIESYFRVERRLPASIDALERHRGDDARTTRDPGTGNRYGYRVIDSRRYELCATFAAPTPPERKQWSDTAHPAGRHCARKAVDEGDRASDLQGIEQSLSSD